MMFSLSVTDMPKAKAFYSDKLGLKVTTGSRTDDHFAAADVAGAHRELSAKGAKVDDVKNDLFGPGSGVKWFSLADPDGNQILLVQARM